MTRTAQAKLLVLSVFFVGLLSGVVLTNLYEVRVLGDAGDRGKSDKNRDHAAFVEYLELTSDQETELDGILERAREEYRELRSQTRPMYRELKERSRDKIRAILTDDQRTRYERWIEEERKKH